MKLTIQNKEEQEQGVQFLSDEYDDLAAGKEEDMGPNKTIIQ